MSAIGSLDLYWAITDRIMSGSGISQTKPIHMKYSFFSISYLLFSSIKPQGYWLWIYCQGNPLPHATLHKNYPSDLWCIQILNWGKSALLDWYLDTMSWGPVREVDFRMLPLFIVHIVATLQYFAVVFSSMTVKQLQVEPKHYYRVYDPSQSSYCMGQKCFILLASVWSICWNSR